MPITPTTHGDIAAFDAAFDDPNLFRYFPAGITSTRPAAGSAQAGIDNPDRLPLTLRTTACDLLNRRVRQLGCD